MFFDNASTTKVDDKILDNFKYLNDTYFYNPGGLYLGGRNSKNLIETCRKDIMESLNAENGTIVFTGSATEANNLALFGLLKKNTRKILVSMGEHPSVYNSALEIKQRGYDVEFVSLNSDGTIDMDDFKSKMTENVDIVSVMHVSNETGSINDIGSLVKLAREVNPKVIFHCDGVQAVGKINVDIESLDVDMYTMSAHKIHGLKGVGALYVKNGVRLKPIVFGGGQESGLRSGTENILGIYSLALAIKNATEKLDENYEYVKSLKNEFLKELEKTNLKYVVHSGDTNSPYIVSISFLNCRAETILNMLSDRGVYIGNGSACSSKKSGNRILSSMGVPFNQIESNLRISFSKFNTIDEVDLLVKSLCEVVEEYISKAR